MSPVVVESAPEIERVPATASTVLTIGVCVCVCVKKTYEITSKECRADSDEEAAKEVFCGQRENHRPTITVVRGRGGCQGAGY